MLLVVDGNWLFNRAAHTAEQPHQIAWSLVSMACADAVYCKADSMLVAFDGPRGFRYDLWPLYKIQRKGVVLTKEQMREALKSRSRAKAMASAAPQKPREVYQYLPLVQHYLTELGIKWVQYPELEADDVLSSAAHQLQTKLVLSAPDKDIYQCLTKNNVRILSTKYEGGKMKRTYITAKKVMERYEVRPDQMVDYQTLVGDSTDGILSVVGPKTAVQILQKYDTLANAVKHEQQLKAEHKHLKLNAQLVRLRVDAQIPQDLSIVPNPSVRAPKSYKELVSSMNRGSLF